MAKINYDFYSGNDIYNDGEIEEKLLNLYKDGKKVDGNKDGFFFLTTDIRSNILNWYPFTKNDSVLEIGCGCGTITGILTDNCGSVVSVDGSKRRSEITYNRHKDKDNLEVYAGNFQDIKFNKKFNYIVVVGVFEYAKQFFDSKTPFDSFVENIKELLLPDGKVLLAIENRYGIKYWAGANEDHLSKPFVGLEGYDQFKVQTFGKKELIDLFGKHGFVKSKFFYPFPDYKLPFIVYSDDRLPNINEVTSIPIYPYGDRINFNIHRVLSGIIKNNMFDFFSNSFLVEFGLNDSVLSDVVYAKNSDNRTLDYKTITVENDKNIFYKIPCSKNAKKHLDEVIDIHNEIKKADINICDFYKEDDKYYSKKVDGCSVTSYICDLVNQNKWSLVNKEIDNIINFYFSLSDNITFSSPIIDDINKIYGNKKTYILKKSIIDGNISNLFKDKDNNYIFIDQEWITDKQIPTEYLIYYSLVYLFHSCRELSSHVSIDKYLIKYNISKEKIDLFNKIEMFFYNENKKVLDNEKIKNLLSCSYANYYLIKKCIIYADTGNDFNDENKFVCKYELGKNENEYFVDIKLPANTKRVRFDPIFQCDKLIAIKNIKINDKSIKYDSYNIEKINGKDSLINNYPYIVFDYTLDSINISITFENITSDDIVNQLSIIRNEYDENINKMNGEFVEKEKDYLDTINEVNTKFSNQCEVTNNLLEQIEILNKQIDNSNKQINNLNDRVNNLIEQIGILNELLENSKSDNIEISNSLKNKIKEFNILSNDCAHLKKQVKELDGKNQKMVEQCNNLKEKIKFDKIDINDLEVYCKKIEKKYSKTLRCKIGKVIKKI